MIRFFSQKFLWLLFCSTNLFYEKKKIQVNRILRKNLFKEFDGEIPFGDKICVFAAYPLNKKINDALFYYLESINKLGFSIVFLSNKDFDEIYIPRLKKICTKIIIRDNYGRDFGAYKEGILKFKQYILDAQELLIANDSVVGPIFDLNAIFENMRIKSLDFWGVSESYARGFCRDYHISSYFIVVQKTLLNSNVFWDFWNNYKETQSRYITIRSGEKKFTELMNKKGFSCGSYINAKKIVNFLSLSDIKAIPSLLNPSIFKPFVGEYIKTNMLNYFVKDDKSGFIGAIIRERLLYDVLKILYSTNHYVFCFKIMNQIGYPFIKKDIIIKQDYFENILLDIKKDIDDENIQILLKEIKISKPSNIMYYIKDKITE